MTPIREPIFVALQQLLNNAYAWVQPVARKLQRWDNVPKEMRPACFLYEGGQENYQNDNSPNAKRNIRCHIFIYTNASDSIGATQINTLFEAIETALQPAGADQHMCGGRQTLGGLCYNARINGSVERNPGDFDGDGMLIIPLTIELP